MKIYFDNVLIDQDYYAEISQKYELFTDTFKLGGTASNTFTIKIDKTAVSSIPTNIKFTINDVDYAYTKLDSYNDEDDFLITYELADSMLDLNFNYDASEIINASQTGYVTTYEILEDICSKANLVLSNASFTNDDIQVNYYDNTITARQYVGYIAELNGGYAIINKSGQLELKKFTNTSTSTIYIDQLADFKIGQYYKISRVVYDNGIQLFENGTTTNNTLYINSDNPFIQNQEIVTNIYNSINNFEFYNFKTSNSPIVDVLVGQTITFTDGTNNYPTIAQYKLNYNGGWIGGYELNLDTPRQEETQIKGVNSKVKSLKTEVDRGNAQLTIVANQTNTIQEDLNNVYTKEQTNTLIQNAENGLTNVFSQSGGNNLLRNTAPYYMTNETTAEFWSGAVSQMQETDSASGYAMKLQGNSTSQNVTLSNGDYSVSFKYKRLLSTATLQVKYNGRTFDINDESGEVHTSGLVNAGSITIEIICNVNNGYELYDLMLKHGTEGTENMLVWTQNANESISDTIQISKGITASSSATNTKATMNSDGFRVVNKTTGDLSYRGTDTGIECNDLTSKGKSNVSGLLIQAVGDEIWISGGTM